MECLEPGAIRDEELLAYLAGEKVRPIVEQHLANCQRCSAQLADYRRLELELTSKLYRWDCPPNQVLGEYELGLLGEKLAAAVKNHLHMCVHCAAEIATLANFVTNDPMLAEPVTAPHLSVSVRSSSQNNNHRSPQGAKRALDHLRDRSTAGVRRIVATLLPLQPRLAYQRGDSAQADVWPRRYAAEDVSISIQIERGPSRRDSLQLIGFVTRKGEALEALQGMQVLLSSQDVGLSLAGTQYTQNIDELGNFVFSALAPATYTLELQFPESVIVIDQLPLALQD